MVLWAIVVVRCAEDRMGRGFQRWARSVSAAQRLRELQRHAELAELLRQQKRAEHCAEVVLKQQSVEKDAMFHVLFLGELRF